jgi:hypothetical protein
VDRRLSFHFAADNGEDRRMSMSYGVRVGACACPPFASLCAYLCVMCLFWCVRAYVCVIFFSTHSFSLLFAW